ncbi:unnamed protein product [Heligmosomoides polygyrus]|uniref:Fibroblast growth factor 4 n=1 Tax=Heligmosomoides polygyrus TaxID=6339 RepID=A0A183GSW0_HELPZ|nr:unnamed protein product [Heligmosomoides polygyrus]
MAVLWRRYALLVLIQGVLCHFESAPPPDPDKSKSQYYEINVENLKGMWHNAMIRGLIKVGWVQIRRKRSGFLLIGEHHLHFKC